MVRKREKFCEKVRKNIAKWDKYFKKNNDLFHEFNYFTFVKQWEPSEENIFTNNQKTPMTVNKMATLVNHLLGEQRQNTPNLQVIPREETTEESADIRTALVKNIALDSNSKTVYQNAFQQAVVGGYGNIWVSSQYENDESFDQEITIFTIDDPTNCFWDVSAKNEDRTDGMYCGYKVRMSREMFSSKYGESALDKVSSADNDTPKIDEYSDQSTGYVYNDKNSVTVIHYFERETSYKKLVKLSNGKVAFANELEEIERDLDNDIDLFLHEGEPVYILADRMTPVYKIMHYKLAGNYELEKSEFASESMLPGVFVDQNSITTKEGEFITRPFMKDIKYTQIYLNYLFTQSAYIVKMMRFDQFLVSKENIQYADTQSIWRDPQNVQGGLYFDESESGFIPQQLSPPQLSPALTDQMNMCMSNIQTSSGMYDTQIGQQGNEISGRAIDARTKRGSYNTYVAFDSLNRAITSVGKLVNEMIPKIYDTERTLTLELNGQPGSIVNINEPVDEYGSSINNDMSKGKFNVYLMPGPSFEGQKQEALESLQAILQANPGIFNMIADLYAENLPLANSIEIRNRLKTLVPPNVIQAGKTGETPPQDNQGPPPELMIKIQELQLEDRSLQLKEAELMNKNQKLKQDEELKLLELQQKREENAAQLQEQILRYQAEMKRTGADIDIAHANNLVNLLTHHPKG